MGKILAVYLQASKSECLLIREQSSLEVNSIYYPQILRIHPVLRFNHQSGRSRVQGAQNGGVCTFGVLRHVISKGVEGL